MDYVNCQLCPRRCGVDRTAGKTGYCRCPDTALVAKAMLHKWEEPALAGSGGSGAVFFGGCTLGCKYCQNAAISGGPGCLMYCSTVQIRSRPLPTGWNAMHFSPKKSGASVSNSD